MPQFMAVARRALAILPQVPALSHADVKKELVLRRAAERALAWKRQAAREQAAAPQFGSIRRPSNVLKVYARKRAQLTPRDTAAAFYALGRLTQHAAYKVGCDPLHSHPLAIELRADLAACTPVLSSKDLANALRSAAYLRSTDQVLIDALCGAAASKARTHFSLRDVASTIYSLGRLGRPDEDLLPGLLSRLSREASSFHAIEMSQAASGLADLQLAPPTALRALSRAAIPKIEQFGASELPKLLSSLSSLGWHDEQLLRLSTARLGALLTDMSPKGLSEMALSLAASRLWIPSTLDELARETELKAADFSATEAAVMLAALGRLHWDHEGAVHALIARIVACAQQELRRTPKPSPSGRVLGARGNSALLETSQLVQLTSGATTRLSALSLSDAALATRALSLLPSSATAPKLHGLHGMVPELLQREQERGAVTGADGVVDQRHLQDLALLSNGLVHLPDATVPHALVEHLERVLSIESAAAGAAHVASTSVGHAASMSQGANGHAGIDPEARSRRRMRAKLANALQVLQPRLQSR